MRIHLIEDDPVLSRSLQVNLELEGHNVSLSYNIRSALENKGAFDFVILDLGLPDGSGFDYLLDLRKKDHTTPLIILTAQTEEDSVVKGLQFGANDYMKQPYSFRELNARMNVILRKPIVEGKKINFGELCLNLATRTCYFGQQEIDLNRREFDILSSFVKRAEMIVSRESILELFGNENEIFDRTIDSHISHLRKKMRAAGINEIIISSVYGLGYRLEKSNEK